MGKTRVRPVIKTVHAVWEYRYQSRPAVQFVQSPAVVARFLQYHSLCGHQLRSHHHRYVSASRVFAKRVGKSTSGHSPGSHKRKACSSLSTTGVRSRLVQTVLVASRPRRSPVYMLCHATGLAATNKKTIITSVSVSQDNATWYHSGGNNYASGITADYH